MPRLVDPFEDFLYSVPAPVEHPFEVSAGRKFRRPFHLMRKGDYFYLPTGKDGEETMQHVRNIRGGLKYFRDGGVNRSHNAPRALMKFTVRPDQFTGQYICRRIS